MDEPKVFFGKSDTCDFEQDIWTFAMIGDYRVSSGEYAIMRRNDYQMLLSMARKNEGKL